MLIFFVLIGIIIYYSVCIPVFANETIKILTIATRKSPPRRQGTWGNLPKSGLRFSRKAWPPSCASSRK